jgi:hypothetical protein
MKKRTNIYLSSVIVLLLAIVAIYYFSGGFTGYAVFEEYTNETECVAAGYTWENLIEQNCTNETIIVNETFDCEPCLEYEDLNGTQGDCISWSSCVNETTTEEETCVDVVIGGQCVGCGVGHLDLCLDETDCTDAGGYWYDDVCNAEEEVLSCANSVDLCLDETNCTSAGGYWYNEGCHADQCMSNSDCISGYVCDDRVCVEEEEDDDDDSSSESTSSKKSSGAATPSKTASINTSELLDFSLTPGDEQEMVWSFSNSGIVPVSNCSIVIPPGNFSSWISFIEDIKTLNAGETGEFIFSVVVPEETEPGLYELSASITCLETNLAKTFNVEVTEKKLDFEILSAERISGDQVTVIYSLTELTGEEQDVEIQFSILDMNNNEIASASESQVIEANQKKDLTTDIQVEESLEGNMNLNAEFNSQLYSSSVSESFTLGAAPVGGFAIFEGVGGTGGFIVFVIVVLVLVAIFFVVRKLRTGKIPFSKFFRRTIPE